MSSLASLKLPIDQWTVTVSIVNHSQSRTSLFPYDATFSQLELEKVYALSKMNLYVRKTGQEKLQKPQFIYLQINLLNPQYNFIPSVLITKYDIK